MGYNIDVLQKKNAHLLTLCGEQTYERLRSHLPQDTSDCLIGASFQASWLVPTPRNSGSWPQIVALGHRTDHSAVQQFHHAVL